MTQKVTSLTQTYGGYFNTYVPPEDAELTHVGPGTPCGEYLRRYWQPVAHTGDLGERPLAIRILGEDLVVFRDGSGRIGLLHAHCAHRGASLEYGVIQEHGIRCCYHGWHFDVDGRILEMPTSHREGPYRGRLCQGAYPIREFHGLVFAYLGPPDLIPPFPLFDTFASDDFVLCLGDPVGLSNLKPCNWLQVMDNVVDPAHEVFLHTRYSGHRFIDYNGREVMETGDMGVIAFEPTPIGLVAQETRRVGEDVWVRGIECIAPNIAQIAQVPILPPQYRDEAMRLCMVPRVTRWRVPVDDHNTREFAIVRRRPDEPNRYAEKPSGVLKANYGGRSYEEMQSNPGDYEVQISQRPIARHELENLTETDKGIILFRQMIRDGIAAVRAGRDPLGAMRPGDAPIPTYGSDTVLRVPRAQTPEEDRELLIKTARRVHEEALAVQPIKSANIMV